MKCFKITVSFLLTVMIMFSMLIMSVITSFATTIISGDDYDFAVASETEFAVYRYKGSDTDVVLPATFLGKPVVGIYSDCFFQSDITSVHIPDSYTFIGASAFYGCENLIEIVVPKGITNIGSLAFNSCTSLESVDLSAATELKSIPYAAFQDDASLSTINIPDNITEIQSRAFVRTPLTRIVIPDSVEMIGDYAFSECSSLSSVALPKGLEVIGEGLFEECVSLEAVEIPNRTKYISDFAFYNTSGLNSIYIPKSVESIGKEVFSNSDIQIGVAQGSAADSYCAENGFTNVTRYVLGDANSDGTMNITDATYIQKYCANLRSFNSAAQKDVADVTGDGEVSVRDATLIQMRLAEIISSFD